MSVSTSLRSSCRVSISPLSRIPIAGPSRATRRSQSTTPTPSSSSSSSTSFEPALQPGLNPAYDAALKYLESYSSRSQATIQSLQSRLSSTPNTSSTLRAKLESRISKLDLERKMNSPSLRRLYAETKGKGLMDSEAIRVLAKKEWLKEGGLDLLMQRIIQMNVVPDLVGEIQPGKLERLTLSLNQGNESGMGEMIQPGSICSSSAFATPPHLTLQLFDHPIETHSTSESDPIVKGKFTLLVIDPDYPEHESSSYSQRLHYLKTDIPLSVLSGETNLFSADGNELFKWEAPSPAKGSGKHRYVFIVVNQSNSSKFIPPTTRENFDLRTYLSSNSLTPSSISGITLFRSVYTPEDHDHINSTFIARGMEGGMPEYGKPPKEMKYGYPMRAKEMRMEDIRREAWEGLISEIQGMQQEEVPVA